MIIAAYDLQACSPTEIGIFARNAYLLGLCCAHEAHYGHLLRHERGEWFPGSRSDVRTGMNLPKETYSWVRAGVN